MSLAFARLGEQLAMASVERYGILGSEREQVYDDVTLLAAKSLSAPYAALSFISGPLVWCKSTYGFNCEPQALDATFTRLTLETPDEITFVEDALSDPRVREHPMVTGEPHIRSYASAPLVTPDGVIVGNVAVVDTKPRRFNEDQALLLKTMARQTIAQLELRHQANLLSFMNERLERLASCDSLTGLKNHRAFQEHLENELLYSSRHNTPLSLILLDVDHFKEYNDSFGHPAGDDVLRAVALLLLQVSRDYDFVARYGGEEFAIVLRGADAAEAAGVAERLRATIASANWPHTKVTASLGVSSFGPHLRNRAAMIEEADQLLYQAKQSGRNRVAASFGEILFDPAVWDSLTGDRCTLRQLT